MKKFLVISAVLLFHLAISLYADEEINSLDNALKKELGLDDLDSSKKISPDTKIDPNSNEKNSPPNKNTNNENSELLKSPSGDKTPSGNKSPGGDEKAEELNPIQERYATDEESGSAFWLLLKVLFVFGGLSFVMIYILKVMAKTRNSRFPVQGKMSLLSSIAIGTNKQVQIVEVADKLLVLGVGDSSVNLLTEITDIEEKSKILQMKEDFNPTNENFLVTLLDTLKEFKPKLSAKSSEYSEYGLEDDSELLDWEKRQEESLKRIRASKKDLGLDTGGAL